MLTAHQQIAILRRLPGWTLQDSSLDGIWRLASPQGGVFHLRDERRNVFDPRDGFSVMPGSTEAFDVADTILELLRSVLGSVEIYPVSLPPMPAGAQPH